jgi:cytochrome c oxidase subunit III
MNPSTGAAGNWAETPDRFGSDRRASLVGLLILLVSTGIVFLALVVAFSARRLLGNDWIPMPKPPILWLNTGILIASSVALDLARRALKARQRVNFNRWWTAATGLGVLFLVGQAIAWSQLRAAGIYVATNPSSSFFYVLTAVHALHLIGGITALTWVDVQAIRLRLGPAKRTAIDVCAVFWHFLDALWIMLMAIFYLWK